MELPESYNANYNTLVLHVCYGVGSVRVLDFCEDSLNHGDHTIVEPDSLVYSYSYSILDEATMT